MSVRRIHRPPHIVNVGQRVAHVYKAPSLLAVRQICEHRGMLSTWWWAFFPGHAATETASPPCVPQSSASVCRAPSPGFGTTRRRSGVLRSGTNTSLSIERNPGKACVGGSIPSLAATIQGTGRYHRLSPPGRSLNSLRQQEHLTCFSKGREDIGSPTLNSAVIALLHSRPFLPFSSAGSAVSCRSKLP